MSFTLPDLPYPHDALQPFMSRETLEFHHDKHHKAYVDNGNKLLQGSEFEGKSLEEIVKGSHGVNQGLFNNAGQHRAPGRRHGARDHHGPAALDHDDSVTLDECRQTGGDHRERYAIQRDDHEFPVTQLSISVRRDSIALSSFCNRGR